MDKYIIKKVPKNSKKPGKFEIELILKAEGVEKIMKMIKKQE